MTVTVGNDGPMVRDSSNLRMNVCCGFIQRVLNFLPHGNNGEEEGGGKKTLF